MTDEIERQRESVRAELEPLATKLQLRQRREAETLSKLEDEKNALTKRGSEIDTQSPVLEERRIVAQNAVSSLARGRLDKVMGSLYSVLAITMVATIASSWAVFAIRQLLWQGVVLQAIFAAAGVLMARVVQRRRRKLR